MELPFTPQRDSDSHPEMGQARGARMQEEEPGGKGSHSTDRNQVRGLGVVKHIQQMMGQHRRLRTKTTNQLRGQKSALR